MSKLDDKDMDDTKDKIRRNLVMFSSLTIFLLIFSISEKEFLKNLLGDAEFSIEKIQIYWIYFFILLYLVIRYRFSEAFEDFINTYKKEKLRLKLKYLDKLVTKELVKTIHLNKNSNIFNSPTEVTKKYVEEVRGKHKNSIFKITNEVAISPTYNEDYWSGVIEFQLSVQYDSNYESKATKSEKLNFKITGFKKLKIKAILIRNLLLYSKTSIEYLVPLFLWGCAIFMLLYRMGIYYGNDLLLKINN